MQRKVHRLPPIQEDKSCLDTFGNDLEMEIDIIKREIEDDDIIHKSKKKIKLHGKGRAHNMIPLFSQERENIRIPSKYRNEIYFVKKENYTLEEVLILINNCDSTWEKDYAFTKHQKNYIS